MSTFADGKREEKMKKKVSLLLLMAITASCMSIASCSNNKTPATSQTVGSEAVITVPADTTTATTTEATTETTTEAAKVDPWSGTAVAGKALGAAQIARSVLGKSVDEVLSGRDFAEYMGRSTSFNHDLACTVVIPEAGFEIEGQPFKKIYLWKDGDQIAKVTYAIREKEFLAMTKNEATALDSDMRKDTEMMMVKVRDSLKNAFGGYKTADAELTGASKSERCVWENDGTTVEVTYGLDCYGIEGNNEFRIDVYRTDKASFGPSQEVMEFRQKVYRMYNCYGLDYKTAKAITQDVLGVTFKKEQKDKRDFYYSVNLTFEGVKFNQVIIRTNSKGKVCEVYLVNDKSKAAQCKTYYNKLYKKLEDTFGKSFIPVNVPQYKGVINGRRDNGWCILASKNIKSYNRFYFIFNNESLKRQ